MRLRVSLYGVPIRVVPIAGKVRRSDGDEIQIGLVTMTYPSPSRVGSTEAEEKAK
ncbi:MAG TPA: hypothetical protein VGL03_05160 [Thermoanaerobaculia bacterium]